MKAEIKAALPYAGELARQIFVPHGRCNRQGFLAVAIALLTLQSLMGAFFFAAGTKMMSSPAGLVLNAPIFWIGAMAAIKRMHDIGRSGWLIPAAFAGWFTAAFMLGLACFFVFGPDSMVEGSVGFWVIFAAMTLPAFGALLWLHASSGESRSNRFGDVPGITGFSPAPKRDVDLPDDAIAAS